MQVKTFWVVKNLIPKLHIYLTESLYNTEMKKRNDIVVLEFEPQSAYMFIADCQHPQ